MAAGKIALSLTLVGVTLTALSGCGFDTPTRRPAAGGSSVSDPSQGQVHEPVPQAPNRDPDEVPTNIPDPVPQPLEPPAPGEITVRAVAHSVTSNPLAAFDGRSLKAIAIYTNLIWTPIKGAATYRISRAVEGSDRFVVRGTVNGSVPVFRDGGTPLGNLNVATEYKYLIEAFDTSGNVIARGNDSCRPMYPLDVPALKEPANGAVTNGLQPVMRWSYVDENNQPKAGPDGFYTEVFSGTTLLPVWRGFRLGNLADSIQYGNQVDFYPGTAPAIWAFVLKPGSRYTWSVTAYKTDTGNAITAKAFATSNAPAWTFTVGTAP
ncbi:hypothetical protein D3C72_131600 [compost metagenome]